MKNRFGMFIHWGIYALYADHEQVLARRNLDNAAYERRMAEFNPVRYDPEEWVKLAKNAGMRYICFTAKHHDGFCMWDTRETAYNIMNTPYGRDVLKLLSDACRKHGMALSLYYSNPDWHEPSAYNPLSTHQWKSIDPSKGGSEKYRAFVKAQLTELLTNYGPIYTLFWDIPPRYEDPSLNALARRLQPGILINDRGYDAGDFSTPERSVPEGSRFERMTEACDSVGEQSWGYRENEDYHTPRYLMSAIDKIMAMGGSYLLNVGPMADGRIPDEAARIVRRVGDWYTRMNGALEDTLPDPFDYQIPANPVIALTKAGKTYLHFYKGLTSTAVTLRACPKIPRAVRLLNNAQFLPFEETALPNHFDQHGRALGPVLHIHHIPAESLDPEPLVLEIEWE